MLLQATRFASVVLTALILGPAFCHVLEMPVKMALPPRDYLIVQQIYTTFGPVGSILEPAAILSAIVLAVRVRGGRAFVPALVGALCLVAALASWFVLVNPVNAHWVAVVPGTVPGGVAAWRSRWEWGHVVHALLLFGALVALVVSVLAEIPGRDAAAGSRRGARERAA